MYHRMQKIQDGDRLWLMSDGIAGTGENVRTETLREGKPEEVVAMRKGKDDGSAVRIGFAVKERGKEERQRCRWA